MKTRKFASMMLTLLFIASLLGVPKPVLAQENVPSFDSFPMTDTIIGGGWDQNTVITIEVDDPLTAANPDVTQTISVGDGGYPSDLSGFGFTFDEYDLKASDLVTVTDGVTTKQHVVDPFSITAYDFAGDKVYGTAQPNQAIEISISPTGHGVYRFETADQAGNWVADFSIPGDDERENETADLRRGVYTDFQIIDEDNDRTSFWYYIPDPYVVASAEQEVIHSFGWSEGSLLTLVIEDLATSQSPDYSTTIITGPSSQSWPAMFALAGIFDIKPGQHISLSDGLVTKEITVSALVITNIDMDADTISGTGTPGSSIRVSSYHDEEPDCFSRSVLADENGNWLADFSVEASGQTHCGRRVNITYDMGGGIYENDGDGDATFVFWNIPNLFIEAWINTNYLNGNGWTPGSTVTISVDDPNTLQNPDYSNSAVVTTPQEGDPAKGTFDINPEYDVKPGDIFSVSDGVYTKTLVVSNLAIHDYDLATGLIKGTASPNHIVHLLVSDDSTSSNPNWYNRWETSDANGNWTANFTVPGELEEEQSTVNLADGFFLGVNEPDEDNDRSFVGFPVRSTLILVWPNDDLIEGQGWPPDSQLTITIDDPATPTPVDYSGSVMTGPSEEGPRDCNFSLDLNNIFDIKAGFIVKVTAGQISKELIVSNLAVFDIDLDADVISGTADPNMQIRVGIDFTDISMDVQSDSNGSWSADFTGQYDLKYGENIDFNITDTDGDITLVGWSAPRMSIFAIISHGDLAGYDWQVGSNLTITIDDPATIENPDYVHSITISGDEADFGANFGLYLDNNELKIGNVIIATDGTYTKQLVISDIQITDVDLDSDIVTGTSEPDRNIEVWNFQDNAKRNVTSDQNGNWSVDFSIPGDLSQFESVSDLRDGSVITARVSDPDGDRTQYFRFVFIPNIGVNINSSTIYGSNWPVGMPVTITVDDPATSSNPDVLRTVTVNDDPEGDSFVEDFSDQIQIKPGFLVVAANGKTTKTLVVAPLQFTDANTNNDTVTGQGTPGQTISLFANGTDGSNTRRNVVVDSEGIWSVDFSVPGENQDEQTIFNIVPGSNFTAYQFDEDNDDTDLSWSVPNPIITVRPDEESIEGYEWPTDSVITLVVGDPAQPDYTTTVTSNPIDQDHSSTWFLLDLKGLFDLQAGQSVTVYDDTFTKNLLVAEKNLTMVDPLTDSISGNTAAGIFSISSWSWNGDFYAFREVEATPGESWRIDFSVPGDQEWENAILDIKPGTQGQYDQADEDRDSTYYRWSYAVNHPPLITSLTVPTTPVKVKQIIHAVVAFTDPDLDDTHTITFDWGDGSAPSSGTKLRASHVYYKSGIYKITATVTDAAGESDTITSSEVIVFNPNPGSVNGNGQIISPPGAYIANPALTGKLTFDFDAVYKKKAATPKGDLTINFTAANLKFKSTAYDWMIISGNKAYIQGSGKINGKGKYGFLLSVKDGRSDSIRIKIWNLSNGSVIYDSQPGAEISADPITPLKKGWIDINQYR